MGMLADEDADLRANAVMLSLKLRGVIYSPDANNIIKDRGDAKTGEDSGDDDIRYPQAITD